MIPIYIPQKDYKIIYKFLKSKFKLFSIID